MPSHTDPEIQEALDQVLQAESRAQQSVLEATTEARRIRAEANRQARELVARLTDETRALSARILEQALNQATLEKQNRLAQFRQSLEPSLQLNESVAQTVVAAAASELLRSD